MTQHAELKKVTEVHKRMVDHILLEPDVSNKGLAECFGYSETWISIIVNSDAFQAELEKRRQAHERDISETILTKAQTLAGHSLDYLNEMFEKEPSPAEVSPLTPAFVKDVADMSLKRLMPAKQSNLSPGVNINIGMVSPEVLQRARAKLERYSTAPAPPAIEVIEDGTLESGTATGQ